MRTPRSRSRFRRPALMAGVLGTVLVGAWSLVIVRQPGEAATPAHQAGGPVAGPGGVIEAAIAIDPDARTAVVDQLLTSTTAEQRPALADRTVTLDELRGAVDALVDCFASGFNRIVATETGPLGRLTVETPTTTPDEFDVTYSYTIDSETLSSHHPKQIEATNFERACHARYVQDVRAAYQAEKLADPAYVTRAVALFTSCTAAAGLPDLGPTPEAALTTLSLEMAGVRSEPLMRCLSRSPAVAIGLAPRSTSHG